MADARDCFICRKHQEWPNALRIHADDLVNVTHVSADYQQPWSEAEPIYHGWLFAEPVRHLPGWAELTPEEASRLGDVIRICAAALKTVGCDHVYAFTYGDGQPHLHVHLLGRWPGAPERFRTTQTAQWPDAPRSRLPEIGDFTTRLREAFTRAAA